ncbi:MAG: hypothetical protein WCF30_03345 [Terracidiphilus sp.]
MRSVASQAKVKSDGRLFGHLQETKNSVSALGAFKSARLKLSLLPNRPVVVDSLTLKEAVMHHAEPKQQNKDNEDG